MWFRIPTIVISAVVIGLSIYSLTLTGSFSTKDTDQDRLLCLLLSVTGDKDWDTRQECYDRLDQLCEIEIPETFPELIQYCALREEMANNHVVASWIAMVVIGLCAIVIGIAGLLTCKDRKTTDVMAVYENHP